MQAREGRQSPSHARGILYVLRENRIRELSLSRTVDGIVSMAFVNALPISHSAVFLTGVAKLFATSVDRVVQMRKERGRGKRDRKDIICRDLVPSSTIQRAILNKCALLLVLMATSEVPVHEECIMWL